MYRLKILLKNFKGKWRHQSQRWVKIRHGHFKWKWSGKLHRRGGKVYRLRTLFKNIRGLWKKIRHKWHVVANRPGKKPCDCCRFLKALRRISQVRSKRHRR